MLAVLAQAQGSYLQFGGGKAADAGVDLTPVYVGVVALVILVIVIQVLRKTLGRKATTSRGNGRSSSASKRARAKQRDKMQEFASDYIDMDPLINPPTGRARPIPEELKLGTILISQRLGVKCLLLDDLEEVSRNTLKEICARKIRPTQALYIPMGFQVYKDEILHQGRAFTSRVERLPAS